MGAGAQLMSSFLFSLKLQPTWILPSQRGASCLVQPNPESPPQTHPWLITMVVPNSVKLTILINQWTVLGLNSEDISMFRSNFHVNYISSLFVFLNYNSQKPILVRLGQKRVPGFRLGLQSRLNGILITSSITICVRICSQCILTQMHSINVYMNAVVSS